jgi:phosphatidylglycerophosphatase A
VSRLALVLGTWFGCGYFPWGPGTVGSIAAMLIAIALHQFVYAGRAGLVLVILVLLLPAIWAASQTALLVGKKDPGIVVVDEVLGQWITLLGAVLLNWKAYIGGFVLFRIFDIWKPWPIRRLEQLPGGIGIVADDLAAGIYGALILYIGGRFGLY